jgi:hypothetical protein
MRACPSCGVALFAKVVATTDLMSTKHWHLLRMHLKDRSQISSEGNTIMPNRFIQAYRADITTVVIGSQSRTVFIDLMQELF